MGTNLTPEQFKQMNLIDNGDGTYSMQGTAVKNDGIKNVLPGKPKGRPDLEKEQIKLSKKSNVYILNVPPIGKPRMVKSDSWKKRPAVLKYWEYKKELIEAAKDCKFEVPSKNFHVIFYVEMPHSWSSKKVASLNGAPHASKPDVDNMLKGFMDCLCESDSFIHDVRVSKLWATNGYIEVIINKP